MSLAAPAGFSIETGTDPAEDLIGPFYLNRDGEKTIAGMRVEAKHCNGMETVHGGVLMTFADFALCAHARYLTDDQHIVTVTLNTEFVDGAPIGSWLESRSEIIRRTHRLVFVQGLIHCNHKPLLTFSGIGKRIRKQEE